MFISIFSGAVLACGLYLLYILVGWGFRKLSKPNPEKIGKLSHPRQWLWRWRFAMNWLALAFFVWICFLAILGSLTMTERGWPTGARLSLQKLANKQETYRKEHGRYAKNFTELGCKDDTGKDTYFCSRDNIYSFFLGNDKLLPESEWNYGRVSQLSAGLTTPVSKDTFTMFAIGNLDGDPNLDIQRLTVPGTIEHVNADLLKKPGDTEFYTTEYAFVGTALGLFIFSLWYNRRILKKGGREIV